MVRCHPDGRTADAFNPTDSSSRFRPITDRNGVIVPTLYAADRLEGAISETVLHDVPIHARHPRIGESSFATCHATWLVANRDLKLASLHGHGLRKLRISHGELVESNSAFYAETIPWSQKIFDHPACFDGLAWRSRQFNDSVAVMLWQPRVIGAIIIDPSHRSLHLGFGEGKERVEEICQQAAIEIIAA
jgi:hypothetical protein